MRNLATLAALLAVVTTSAAQEPEFTNDPCPTQGTARIFVTAQGKITFNGKPATLEAVKASLEKNKTATKLVCYGRENPQEFEPHPVASQIIEAVISHRLPVAFFFDEAFKKRARLE